MFKKTFLFTIISFLFILPLFASAQQIISISLNQQTFKPNEEIQAKVSFTNPTQKQLKGQIICNFTNLNRKLPPMPFMEEFDLAPNQKSKIFTFKMNISEWMPEGLWKADVEIRDERNNLVIKSYKEFRVIGTKKPIEADVNICRDKDCSERKIVFIKGETVYIKLNSKITDLEISSTIKTPSGEIKYLTFKNNLASFKSDEIGSFSLWVNLSKEGYLKQKIEKDFAYIEKPAEIPSASICNEDGKCTGQENEQNCPQDCLKKKSNVILVLLVVIVILTVLGFVGWRRLKRKNKKRR